MILIFILNKLIFTNEKLKNDEEIDNLKENDDHNHFENDNIYNENNVLNENYTNTQNINGKIECIEGFIGDNPIQIKGCWKCSNVCHLNASCDYPGICNCLNGLIGDGITKCSLPVPVILDYFIEYKELSTINLLFGGIPYNYIIKDAYCLINKEKIQAFNIINKTILCNLPKNIDDKSFISISFDGLEWSDPVELEISKSSFLFDLFSIIGILIGISFGIGSFILLWKIKGFLSISKEENEPLIESKL